MDVADGRLRHAEPLPRCAPARARTRCRRDRDDREAGRECACPSRRRAPPRTRCARSTAFGGGTTRRRTGSFMRPYCGPEARVSVELSRKARRVRPGSDIACRCAMRTRGMLIWCAPHPLSRAALGSSARVRRLSGARADRRAAARSRGSRGDLPRFAHDARPRPRHLPVHRMGDPPGRRRLPRRARRERSAHPPRAHGAARARRPRRAPLPRARPRDHRRGVRVRRGVPARHRAELSRRRSRRRGGRAHGLGARRVGRPQRAAPHLSLLGSRAARDLLRSGSCCRAWDCSSSRRASLPSSATEKIGACGWPRSRSRARSA